MASTGKTAGSLDKQPSAKAPPGIVAVAASAGGLAALTTVVKALPESFASPMVVVQHLDPHHRSMIAEILARHTPCEVKQAEEGERLRSCTVYIAPPDRHLLVNRDHTLSLSTAELVHFLRPSADLLLESVAAVYGPRAVAVVLTGTGRDGSMGAAAIKQRGGLVIAQDEATSEFFGMPGAVIEAGLADFILPLERIGPRLITLIGKGEA
jgi:two-component system, chemotaxis family, protein-glutamate methylesterase/glutaminase